MIRASHFCCLLVFLCWSLFIKCLSFLHTAWSPASWVLPPVLDRKKIYFWSSKVVFSKIFQKCQSFINISVFLWNNSFFAGHRTWRDPVSSFWTGVDPGSWVCYFSEALPDQTSLHPRLQAAHTQSRSAAILPIKFFCRWNSIPGEKTFT